MNQLRTEIDRALDTIIREENGYLFQDLAIQCLKLRYPSLMPVAHKADGGADAITIVGQHSDNVSRVLACSLTATWAKISADAEKIKHNHPQAQELLFATPRTVTQKKISDLSTKIRQMFDLSLVVFERQEFLSVLELPDAAWILEEYFKFPAPHSRFRRFDRVPDSLSKIEVKYQEQAATELDEIPKSLIEDIMAGRVLLILGDTLDSKMGASREKIARVLGQEAGLDSANLFTTACAFEEKFGRQKLENRVMDLLQTAPAGLSTIYDSLASIPFQTIVAWHPDATLERALQAVNPPFRMLVDDNDLARLEYIRTSRDAYLLGGSGISGKGLLLTMSDSVQLNRRISVLARGLREVLARRTLLILNCDLDDLPFRSLYLEATRHLDGRLRPVYVSGVRNSAAWNCKVIKMSAELLLRQLTNLKISDAKSAPSEERRRHPARKHQTPFKYLNYFEAEDRDLFFGREAEISTAVGELLAAPSRILIICGRSGVGKTSLIKAGIIPYLESEHSIAPYYARFVNDSSSSVLAVSTGEGVHSALQTYNDILDVKLEKNSREPVIIIDQTEEAFFKLGTQQLATFFGKIGQYLHANETPRIVFAIREDFLARLCSYRTQIPELTSSVYRLRELSHEAAQQAIVRPAEKCGYRVETELLDQLLNDLSEDCILPAHLQIVCDRLYRESLGANILSLDTYEKLGRTSQILGHHLQESFKNMGPEDRARAKEILKLMVSSEKTKVMISCETIIDRTGFSPSLVNSIISDLIHSVRLVREVERNPPQFELAHESLAESISEWLDETDLKRRELQEMLERQVQDVKHGFEFPLDKLRIVDEHRNELILNPSTLKEILKAFLRIGEWPEFWQRKLEILTPQEIIHVFCNLEADATDEAMAIGLLRLSPEHLNLLPPFSFPKGVAQCIAKAIHTSSSVKIERILKLATLDERQNTRLQIVQETRFATQRKAREILNKITDFWTEDELERNVVRAISKTILRVRWLPTALLKILATMEPQKFYKFLFGQQVKVNRRELISVITALPFGIFDSMPPLENPSQDLIESIAHFVLFGPTELRRHAIFLAFLEPEKRIRRIIVNQLSGIPEKSVHEIAGSWSIPDAREMDIFQRILKNSSTLDWLIERFIDHSDNARIETLINLLGRCMDLTIECKLFRSFTESAARNFKRNHVQILKKHLLRLAELGYLHLNELYESAGAIGKAFRSALLLVATKSSTVRTALVREGPDASSALYYDDRQSYFESTLSIEKIDSTTCLKSISGGEGIPFAERIAKSLLSNTFDGNNELLPKMILNGPSCYCLPLLAELFEAASRRKIPDDAWGVIRFHLISFLNPSFPYAEQMAFLYEAYAPDHLRGIPELEQALLRCDETRFRPGGTFPGFELSNKVMTPRFGDWRFQRVEALVVRSFAELCTRREIHSIAWEKIIRSLPLLRIQKYRFLLDIHDLVLEHAPAYLQESLKLKTVLKF